MKVSLGLSFSRCYGLSTQEVLVEGEIEREVHSVVELGESAVAARFSEPLEGNYEHGSGVVQEECLGDEPDLPLFGFTSFFDAAFAGEVVLDVVKQLALEEVVKQVDEFDVLRVVVCLRYLIRSIELVLCRIEVRNGIDFRIKFGRIEQVVSIFYFCLKLLFKFLQGLGSLSLFIIILAVESVSLLRNIDVEVKREMEGPADVFTVQTGNPLCLVSAEHLLRECLLLLEVGRGGRDLLAVFEDLVFTPYQTS